MPRRPTRAQARGAAILEAVIVIPLLLVVAVAISYLTQTLLGRQQALVEARSCAWRYSIAGCAGPVPAGCEGTLRARAQGDDASDAFVGKLDEVQRDTRGGSFVESVSGVPVVGPLLGSLFSGSVVGHSRRGVEIPEVFQVPGGPAAVHAGGTVVVACNVRPREESSVARELFGALVEL